MFDDVRRVVCDIGGRYKYVFLEEFSSDRVDGTVFLRYFDMQFYLSYADVRVCVSGCYVVLYCNDVSAEVDLRDPGSLDIIDKFFVDSVRALFGEAKRKSLVVLSVQPFSLGEI